MRKEKGKKGVLAQCILICIGPLFLGLVGTPLLYSDATCGSSQMKEAKKRAISKSSYLVNPPTAVQSGPAAAARLERV